MPEVKIYHNPRCSKSRQALALLEDKNIKPTVVEYLKTPFKRSELKNILELLNMSPRELMRKSEPVYKEKNLADDSLTEAQLIKAMIENPILIERPIVIANNKAALGRPPENILDIL